MLVLTRKKGQTLHIGAAIVTIEQIRGNVVKLGIAAPLDVVVDRGEVVAKKRLEALEQTPPAATPAEGTP